MRASSQAVASSSVRVPSSRTRHLVELGADPGRVVVLLLGLLQHLLGHGDRAADRGEGEAEEAGQESHQASPAKS